MIRTGKDVSEELCGSYDLIDLIKATSYFWPRQQVPIEHYHASWIAVRMQR